MLHTLHNIRTLSFLIIILFSPALCWAQQQSFPVQYYKSLGVVNFYERNFLDAVHALQKAVSLDPSDQETLSLLSRVYDSIGDKKLSQKTRVRLQTLNVSWGRNKEVEVPAIKNDLRALGNQFYNRGIYDSAAQSYWLHLQIHKEDTAAIFYLANSYFYLEEYSKAIEFYDLLITKDRNRVEAYNLAGVAYKKQKDYLKARDYFRQCLIKDDRHSAAYYNLGSVHFALDDYRVAQVNLEKALEFLPGDKDILTMLAKVYRLTSQHEKAINAYDKLLKIDAANPQHNYEVGAIYYDLKDYTKAKQHLMAAARGGKKPETCALLGSTLYQLKEYNAALENLKTAAEVYSDRKELQYQAASAANQLKQYQVAEKFAKRAVTLDSKYKLALYELASAYKGLKKRKDAKKYIQMAESL